MRGDSHFEGAVLSKSTGPFLGRDQAIILDRELVREHRQLRKDAGVRLAPSVEEWSAYKAQLHIGEVAEFFVAAMYHPPKEMLEEISRKILWVQQLRGGLETGRCHRHIFTGKRVQAEASEIVFEELGVFECLGIDFIREELE